MKKKVVLFIVVLLLSIGFICTGIFWALAPKGNTEYELQGFVFEAPSRFRVLNKESIYDKFFWIQGSNVIMVDIMPRYSMSNKGCQEMKRVQYEGDETNFNVTTILTEVNGYPAFRLEADTVSEGVSFHMYQYYILAGEYYMEINGIFESKRSSKYEKYVDAIAESVSYKGEENVYQDIYEDEDFYIELIDEFKAKRSEDGLQITYIATDSYKRGFSNMRINKLEMEEEDLETHIQETADRWNGTICEEVLIDKYEAICVSDQRELDILTMESSTYFFEKDGDYYNVTIVNPLQDIECKESYLEILKTWK